MEKEIKPGDRISWQYTHHLNRHSETEKVKVGEFFGKIKHTKNYYGEQLALVLFDGNKRTSKVPFKDLITPHFD